MAADRLYVTLGGQIGRIQAEVSSGAGAAQAKVPLEIIQGAHGMSAYEIAVKNGFVGTEQQWLESIRQPAIDAANEANALVEGLGERFESAEKDRQERFNLFEEGRQTNEAVRQYNEQRRVLAEDARVRAESFRNDAELRREQAEQKRQYQFQENETSRQSIFLSNEQHRQRAEEQRIANEEARVEADKHRRGIDSIETSESPVSGGENVIHITMSDGERMTFSIRNGVDGEKGDKGDKGDKMTFDDLTPSEIALLKGDKGEPFRFSDFTQDQLASLKGEKGDSFKFSDFTPEQLASLKGDKGDPGRSAYDIALENGFTGTEDEWFQSISAPSEEAKQLMVTLDRNEQSRKAAEEIRVTNENSRIESESQRELSEEIRENTFETLRSQSESATDRANDAAKDVEYNMESIRTDASSARQSANESASSADQSAQSADTATQVSEQARQKAEEAISIAKGKATGYVFDTKAEMEAWISVEANKVLLNLGDNLYIRDVNVSDFWWDGSSVQPLETEHPDFTQYVKNTDWASSTRGGVIKVGDPSYGIVLDSNNTLYIARAYESEIKAKTSANKPIVPKYLDYAVKVGITSNTIALTVEEIAKAKQWLGIYEWEGTLAEYNALESIDPNVTYHILEP